jgi:hypothetical protein
VPFTSPIGTGSPNSWQIVVDYIRGDAAGDHAPNTCFVVEPEGLAGRLSAAFEFVPVGGTVAAGCCEHATEMARRIAATKRFSIGELQG